MKKILALAGAGALVLALASPVLAVPFVYVDTNVAYVNNSATAVADTGMNSQSNVADVNHGGGVTVRGSGDRTITTGTADAYAGALVVANTHIGCGGNCGGGVPVYVSRDTAYVNNGADAGAFTGTNAQDNVALVRNGGGVTVSGSGNRTVRTGASDSTARAWTVVNTHWGY